MYCTKPSLSPVLCGAPCHINASPYTLSCPSQEEHYHYHYQQQDYPSSPAIYDLTSAGSREPQTQWFSPPPYTWVKQRVITGSAIAHTSHIASGMSSGTCRWYTAGSTQHTCLLFLDACAVLFPPCFLCKDHSNCDMAQILWVATSNVSARIPGDNKSQERLVVPLHAEPRGYTPTHGEPPAFVLEIRIVLPVHLVSWFIWGHRCFTGSPSL